MVERRTNTRKCGGSSICVEDKKSKYKECGGLALVQSWEAKDSIQRVRSLVSVAMESRRAVVMSVEV
jgi:hypothetical protein